MWKVEHQERLAAHEAFWHFGQLIVGQVQGGELLVLKHLEEPSQNSYQQIVGQVQGGELLVLKHLQEPSQNLYQQIVGQV